MLIPTCIFAKPPVPGKVKTRLISVLGEEGSAGLASAMLQDVWRTASTWPTLRAILATTGDGDFGIRVAPEDVWFQGDGDLGQRIERILTRGLRDAPMAIAVGADTPALTTAHLQGAIEALETNDAVVGPAQDGGFYLLGFRCGPEGLLSSIPWSTADTLRKLKEKMGKARMSVAELEPLSDVDTPGDLKVLEEYLKMDTASAPATRGWYFRRFENKC